MGFGGGRGVGGRGDLGLAVNGDGLDALMVEVDVEDGGAAVVPDGLGDGEVEDDHAFGGLAGIDDGVAEEGRGGESLESGEGGEEIGEIIFFDGAGGDLFAVGGGEGGGEVLEEEREMEAVVDVEGGEDVEVVLGAVAVDDERVGFEDGVGREDGGADDAEVGGLAGGVAENESDDDAKNQKRDENRSEEVTVGGLRKGRGGGTHRRKRRRLSLQKVSG